MLRAGIALRCLRDLTRGGLASAVNEIAGARGIGIKLEETLVPVDRIVTRRLRDPGIRSALRRE
jgi:hydrogenase expression/formation protein HypE